MELLNFSSLAGHFLGDVDNSFSKLGSLLGGVVCSAFNIIMDITHIAVHYCKWVIDGPNQILSGVSAVELRNIVVARLERVFKGEEGIIIVRIFRKEDWLFHSSQEHKACHKGGGKGLRGGELWGCNMRFTTFYLSIGFGSGDRDI